jgi:hypothetical protein
MAVLNGFPNYYKTDSKQLKRTNNEANYSHFTIAWTACFSKNPNPNLSKDLLITSSWI